MKIYTAVVCTEYGLDVLITTKDENKAYKTLADWCRSFADDAQVEDEKELEEMGDKEAIEAYFASDAIIAKGEMGSIKQSELD